MCHIILPIEGNIYTKQSNENQQGGKKTAIYNKQLQYHQNFHHILAFSISQKSLIYNTNEFY